MRVLHYEPSDPIVRPRFTSNTVAYLSEVTSFAEVLPVLDEIRTRVSPSRVIVTIDDLSQATYTSMHAAEADEFSVADEGVDWDNPAEVARVDSERLSRIATCVDTVPTRELGSLREKLAVGESELAVLAQLNAHPDQALDDVVIVQRCPVERDDLVIAGLPNGYFSSDWDTYDNHSVVKQMSAQGYRHFGMGASLMAFDRPAPPTDQEVQSLIASLKQLYGSPASPLWAELTEILVQSRLLLLGYTEGFAEIFTD